MSSSSIIRQHDFQPTAVLVKRRSGASCSQANGSRSNWPVEDQRIEEQRQRLLEQARRQAEEIVAQARQEADPIKETARGQGQQEGYRDGLLAAEASCREAVQTLARLAAQARIDTQSLLRDAESQVLELALTIARKVVERELAVDPTAIVSMVRAALQGTADATATRVRVHPDYLPVLADHWQNDDAAVELVADAKVNPGDCIVDTHNGMVDARVETKLGEIAAALRDVRTRTER